MSDRHMTDAAAEEATKALAVFAPLDAHALSRHAAEMVLALCKVRQGRASGVLSDLDSGVALEEKRSRPPGREPPSTARRAR